MVTKQAYAAAMAGIAAVVFWTLAVVTFWKGTFGGVELTVLTTTTTAAVTSLAAFLAHDRKAKEVTRAADLVTEIAKFEVLLPPKDGSQPAPKAVTR